MIFLKGEKEAAEAERQLQNRANPLSAESLHHVWSRARGSASLNKPNSGRGATAELSPTGLCFTGFFSRTARLRGQKPLEWCLV